MGMVIMMIIALGEPSTSLSFLSTVVTGRILVFVPMIQSSGIFSQCYFVTYLALNIFPLWTVSESPRVDSTVLNHSTVNSYLSPGPT